MKTPFATLLILAFAMVIPASAMAGDNEPAAVKAAVPMTAKAPLPGTAYYSPRLKAQLLLQRLYIIQYGRRVDFWGARVVSMDHNSPLRHINRMGLGDVITRLDGVPIGRGASMDWNGVYSVPEAERHYARTQVRWIPTGTFNVYNHYTNLGPHWSNDITWNPGSGMTP